MTKLRSVPYKPVKSGKELSNPIKPLTRRRAHGMDYFIQCGPNNPVNLVLSRIFRTSCGVETKLLKAISQRRTGHAQKARRLTLVVTAALKGLF